MHAQDVFLIQLEAVWRTRSEARKSAGKPVGRILDWVMPNIRAAIARCGSHHYPVHVVIGIESGDVTTTPIRRSASS